MAVTMVVPCWACGGLGEIAQDTEGRAPRLFGRDSGVYVRGERFTWGEEPEDDRSSKGYAVFYRGEVWDNRLWDDDAAEIAAEYNRALDGFEAPTYQCPECGGSGEEEVVEYSEEELEDLAFQREWQRERDFCDPAYVYDLTHPTDDEGYHY